MQGNLINRPCTLSITFIIDSLFWGHSIAFSRFNARVYWRVYLQVHVYYFKGMGTIMYSLHAFHSACNWIETLVVRGGRCTVRTPGMSLVQFRHTFRKGMKCVILSSILHVSSRITILFYARRNRLKCLEWNEGSLGVPVASNARPLRPTGKSTLKCARKYW